MKTIIINNEKGGLNLEKVYVVLKHEETELHAFIRTKIAREIRESLYFKHCFDIEILHRHESYHPSTSDETEENLDKIMKYDIFARLTPDGSGKEEYLVHEWSQHSDSQAKCMELYLFLATLEQNNTNRLVALVSSICKQETEESLSLYEEIVTSILLHNFGMAACISQSHLISFKGKKGKSSQELQKERYEQILEAIEGMKKNEAEAEETFKKLTGQLNREDFQRLFLLYAKHTENMSKSTSDEVVKEMVEPVEMDMKTYRQQLPLPEGHIEIRLNNDGKQLYDDGKYVVFVIFKDGREVKLSFDSKQGKIIYLFYLLHPCKGFKAKTLQEKTFKEQLMKLWITLYQFRESEAREEVNKLRLQYSDMRNKANASIKKCIGNLDNYQAYEIQGTGRNIEKFINIPHENISMPEVFQQIVNNTSN